LVLCCKPLQVASNAGVCVCVCAEDTAEIVLWGLSCSSHLQGWSGALWCLCALHWHKRGGLTARGLKLGVI
jgi:hypothetical protein